MFSIYIPHPFFTKEINYIKLIMQTHKGILLRHFFNKQNIEI